MPELMLIDWFLLEIVGYSDLPIARTASKKLLMRCLLIAKIWLQTRPIKNEFKSQGVRYRCALIGVGQSLPNNPHEMLTDSEDLTANIVSESSDSLIESIASIPLWRLILLVLKRIGSLIKSWFKESNFDKWLKLIFHGAYLSVFEAFYFFIYIFHFFRAFLTLIKYFTDQDNKNLVEAYKFLYACFKIFISLIMLTFMIMMLVHGISPFGLIAYNQIKSLFYIYTYSKTAISLVTLVFSFCKFKAYDDNPDHAWEKANYRSNVKKHFEILLVAMPIMIVLTLVSLGLIAGPWFYVMLGIASIFLVIDAAKAIYYFKYPGDIPEPTGLSQNNPFINVSYKDYYWRKCRDTRLVEINKMEAIKINRIYLLKEVIIKIFLLQSKLKDNSFSNYRFFSEKPKLNEKIEGLKQLASQLLTDNYEKNRELLEITAKALREDYENLNENDKTLTSRKVIKSFIEALNFKETLEELQSIRNRPRGKDISYSKSFRQSFSRNIGDCGDIERACQKFNAALDEAVQEAPFSETPALACH